MWIAAHQIAEYYPARYREDLQRFYNLRNRGGDHSFNTHDFDSQTGFLHVIPTESCEVFLHFFALEVLIDEIVYTYFRDEYSDFQNVTQYPKIKFCGHGKVTRGDPWSVLHYRPRPSKSNWLGVEAMQMILARFLSVTRNVFDKIDSEKLKYTEVLACILNDADVKRSQNGMRKVIDEMIPQFIDN